MWPYDALFGAAQRAHTLGCEGPEPFDQCPNSGCIEAHDALGRVDVLQTATVCAINGCAQPSAGLANWPDDYTRIHLCAQHAIQLAPDILQAQP